MSDEKNVEAGKQEETELSDDQLEAAAGGAVIPVQTPVEEGVDPFAGVKDVDLSLEEQNKDQIPIVANVDPTGLEPKP